MLTPQIAASKQSFEDTFRRLARYLLDEGDHVDTGHWQALKDVPQTKTIELSPEMFRLDIPATQGELVEIINPNMPWAEDHFRERVSGEPLNPGEQYKNWPWYRGNVETHRTVQGDYDEVDELDEACATCGSNVWGSRKGEEEVDLLHKPDCEFFKESQLQRQFSHTYMERYWCKEVGDYGFNGGNFGIRYEYGDLNDVVDLLVREPFTRQAVLPVWFPEDTGAAHGERVPCSLTYQFILRGGKLHCYYNIRSCDFLRHFRDDVYLTCRLVQWMIEQVQARTLIPEQWEEATPGRLFMFMGSLHVFEGDLPKLRREFGE